MAGVALAGLASCALPDQRTFGAAAYAPPPVPKPAPIKAPRSPWPSAEPLATIRFANASADYAEPLGAAVRAAEARKPDVIFTVVGVAPGGGTVDAQARAAAHAAASAETVMRAIEGMGVPSSRILLASRTDPTVRAEQVEVFVR